VCCGGGKLGWPAATTWRRLDRGGLAGMARLCQQVGVLAQPIAGTLDLHDDGVVQQSVKQCRGYDRIAEYLAPLGEAPVGGEDQGALLVAGVDQLEEQIAGAGPDAQVSDLIDDEQLSATEIADPFAQPALAVGTGVAIVPNEEDAMRTCRDGSPRVVITGINRRSEDMKGLYFARAMREHGAPCTRTEHVQATVQRRAEKAATRQQSAGTVRQENRRSEGPSGHDAAPD
jgi:hypothetical protein